MCRFLIFVSPILALPLFVPSVLPAQSAEKNSIESRLFAFLDRDQSKLLEPGEFKTIPLPMRVWLTEKGINSKKPLSQEQFLKLAPEMMQAIRKGRHAGREKVPTRKVSLVEERVRSVTETQVLSQKEVRKGEAPFRRASNCRRVIPPVISTKTGRSDSTNGESGKNPRWANS